VATAISADTTARDKVTILADKDNTETVKVGGSGSVLFPLVAGASVTMSKTQLSLIYAQSVSTAQTLHVILGGN
jgi:hypothetical protein